MSADKKIDPAEVLKKAESVLSPTVTEALQAAQKAMEDLAAVLGADSAAAVDALKRAGQAASARAGDAAAQARELGQTGLDDLSEAVRRNPLPWLATAAGIGLILGLWSGRSTRS